MLLLTDRMKEVLRLQSVLQTIESCRVLALHQALSHPPTAALVVCDVALDNMTSMDLLKAALAHHRPRAERPLLCLARDPSQLTLALARSIGASAILPHDAPRADVVAAIRRLMKADERSGAAPGEPLRAIEANVEDAGAALAEVLGAAQLRMPISRSSVHRGGNAILTAVGPARIRAWLDVVWRYDDVTYQHSLLVAGLAAAFSRRLGLTLGHQQLISQAALVHDIGKAHIPIAIITKPGKLTPDEMAIIRTHAAIGHDMLSAEPGYDPRLLDIVRHHHEYLDGSGYPDALQGAQVSTLVRMVTLCDIYAALIERRSYKAPASAETALSILHDMGPKLDGALLTAFAAMVLER